MAARKSAAPAFKDLSKREMSSLLRRNYVGRIAFSFHDLVDIRPIHFVLDGEWLFGRTSPSDKLITLRHNQWVAFEVDEIAGPLDWKSVVARGTFYKLDAEGSKHDIALHRRALATIRKNSPDALTEKDKVGFRTELFGIYIDAISGRSCSTKSRK
jgi:nitroimidazol reductase NimA-like FMN-containing flavoprotein (pyridoxamine 5'-phosphate oxidase superfamily)